MFPGMLRPCPVAPASVSGMSGLRLRSPPVMRPPSRTLKMQAAETCRRRHVCLSRKGAADSPGDDVPPESESLRFYRESVEKFEREYSAALRALHGPQHKDLLAVSEDKLFHDETNTIDKYITEIELDRSFLYGEGRRLAQMICLRAGQATELGSEIMASAALRSHHPSEISMETVEQTIRTYVSTFVKIADDTCHRKASQETIISFLKALGGLGAISHILFEDALFAANNIEGCSSEYIPNPDVGAYNRIFQQKMTQLEGEIRSSSPVKAREILVSTLHEAVMHADLFVLAQTMGRKKALAHVLENSNKSYNVGPDDREPDASAETGP